MKEFIIALSAFMAANVISGVIKSQAQEAFDYKKLLKGVIRYGLWLVSFILGVIGIYYYADLEIVIAEEVVTLDRALEIVKLSIITVYAVKFIQNCFEYHGIKKNVKSKDEMGEDGTITEEGLG